MKGFSDFTGKQSKLFIIGTAEKEVEIEINKYSADRRIHYLGWMNSEKLQQFLMAADLYIQLGSQSATMQHALCNGCAVAVYPYESHIFLLKDIAYYIESARDITQLLEKISNNFCDFDQKKECSINFAKKVLDYKIISNIIVSGFN